MVILTLRVFHIFRITADYWIEDRLSLDVSDATTCQVINGRLNTAVRDKYGRVCNQLVSGVGVLTFLHHAHTETLLKAAVLAAVAPPLVHRTVFTGQTHILGVFLHSALWKREKGIPIISLQTPSTPNI